MDTITGGWTKFRVVTDEDIEIFKEATKGLVGVTYEALIVSTQIVAGTNYKFICNAATVTLSPVEYLAEVLIFKPLPSANDTTATIISINKLIPDASDEWENSIEQQYFVFTPGSENSQKKTASYYIDYIGFDAENKDERWTATYSNGKFYHYRKGNKEDILIADHLSYRTEDGQTWAMEIKDGKMLVGPNRNSLKPGKMVYKGWDGAIWTAELMRFIDFHPELKNN